MEAKLETQNREINQLEHCLKREQDRIDFFEVKNETVGTDKIPKAKSVNLAFNRSTQ